MTALTLLPGVTCRVRLADGGVCGGAVAREDLHGAGRVLERAVCTTCGTRGLPERRVDRLRREARRERALRARR